MIPSYESMAKQAIVRVFNTIMTRAGITLIVTVAFSISSMFYNISTDYPFFMVAFLQIVCFAGIYMKLGDLMSMFSLNAGDSQSMGHRIFRRPYLFMRHRARRMEHRIARAVSAGGISGGVAGAVAGSAVAGKRAERKNTASKENRGNTTSSVGQRAGSKVGAVLDTKNKVKDKANAVKENIKDMPTQTAYAVYSAKEKAKSSVSDFKRGMVQEQQSRQTGRLEKQEQHRQNIADKRMELQKAQEARQAQRKTDGSATTGATRPHERPATASTIPKPSGEINDESYRVNVRGAEIEQQKAMVAIVVSLFMYIAFILISAVGTILAVQSLSDSTKYKYRYLTLRRLGINDKSLFKTIRKQLLILFCVPAISAILCSFVMMSSLNNVYQQILGDKHLYLMYFGLNLIIFFLIYSIYWIATYIGFKRNINEES